MDTADDVILRLGLEAHIEGGYFKEVYRSPLSVCTAQGASPGEGLFSSGERLPLSGERSLATSIYFLLKSGQFSAFHRLKSDEIWFFHGGCSLRLHWIDAAGVYSTEVLGVDIPGGEVPQFLFRAGVYFAAEPMEVNSFSLVSCMVSPGFDYRDFELACREELTARFPEHIHIISKFVKR